MAEQENVWEADDGLWTANGEEGKSAVAASTTSDPWSATESPHGDLAITSDGELGDDFSSLSPEQCSELIKSNTNSTPASNPEKSHPSSEFEIDQNYLSKLEKKLERLYKQTGKSARTDMVKQVSDRASVVFMGDSERLDSSSDLEIVPNPVNRLLFPHQQAITAEEKIHLVKSDHLANQAVEDSVVPQSVSDSSNRDADNTTEAENPG